MPAIHRRDDDDWLDEWVEGIEDRLNPFHKMPVGVAKTKKQIEKEDDDNTVMVLAIFVLVMLIVGLAVALGYL